MRCQAALDGCAQHMVIASGLEFMRGKSCRRFGGASNGKRRGTHLGSLLTLARAFACRLQSLNIHCCVAMLAAAPRFSREVSISLMGQDQASIVRRTRLANLSCARRVERGNLRASGGIGPVRMI